MPEQRCRCHPVDVYGYGQRNCPRCHHTSYDPVAQACERRKCGYEGPLVSLDRRSGMAVGNISGRGTGLGSEPDRPRRARSPEQPDLGLFPPGTPDLPASG